MGLLVDAQSVEVGIRRELQHAEEILDLVSARGKNVITLA